MRTKTNHAIISNYLIYMGEGQDNRDLQDFFAMDRMARGDTFKYWNGHRAIYDGYSPEEKESFAETLRIATFYLEGCRSTADLVKAYNFPDSIKNMDGADWLIAAYREAQ